MRIVLRETEPAEPTCTAIVSGQTIQPDQHPAAVYLASLSPGSRRTMRQALGVVATLVAPGSTVETFPWAGLQFQHVAAVRSKLAESYSPATANKILAAIRGTLRAAFTLGQVDSETYTRAISVKSIRGERVVKGRAISQGELRAMFSECDINTPAGARDAAILALGYGAGLRRHEVVHVDVGDYDAESGVLIVHGKGSKERRAFVTNGARAALEGWLGIRGAKAGALFLPVDKAGQVQMRRMTDQSVYVILARLARKAGVPKFSPHDLRRSFIGDLLDAGADIVTVQALAAHANVTTTARYDRRGERTQRRAAELLHVPFGGC
jgi:site-specific recombinase XerD